MNKSFDQELILFSKWAVVIAIAWAGIFMARNLAGFQGADEILNMMHFLVPPLFMSAIVVSFSSCGPNK